MKGGVAFTLEQAYEMIRSHVDADRLEEADRVINGVLMRFPHDAFVARMSIETMMRRRLYSVAWTHIRNLIRTDQADEDVLARATTCIEEMQKPMPGRDFYVIGDSHTFPYGRIDRSVIRYLGAITANRVGTDAGFLDYRAFGVGHGATALVIFGEIDVRLHVLRVASETKMPIQNVLDAVVGQYMAAVDREFRVSGARRQIVAAVVPPYPRTSDDTVSVFGSPVERIGVTRSFNSRLQVACQRFDFGYLDQHTPFAAPDGAMDPRYTDDGHHLSPRHADVLAAQIGPLL